MCKVHGVELACGAVDPVMCRSASFAFEPQNGTSGSKLVDPPTGIEEEYDLGRVLGSGMFSTVRLGKHRLTRVNVAIKILNTMAEGREALDLEIRAMKIVKGHPNIVTLYEVIEDEENFQTYMVQGIMAFN